MRGTVAKRLRAEARRLASREAMEVAPYGSSDGPSQVRWAATSFRGQLRRLKREHRARRSAP